MNFIYVLTDPRYPNSKQENKYVGLTTQSVEERLEQHVDEAEKGGKSLRCVWIRYLISIGKRPGIAVLEKVEDASELGDRERFWIAQMKLQGCLLVNSTKGGEGAPSDKRKTRKVLTYQQVALIRYLASDHEYTRKRLTEMFQVSREVIAGILDGRLYKTPWS